MKTIAALLLLLCSSCCNEGRVEFKSKRDYVQQVFNEYTKKQIFYTQKYLDACEKLDRENMNLYKDSVNMAYYCANNAYMEMNKTNLKYKNR